MRKYTAGVPGPKMLYNVTVESIETNFDLTTQNIADGNSLWPAGRIDTDFQPRAVVTLNSYDPKLHADLMGGRYAKSASSTMTKIVKATISAPDYKVTLDETPLTDSVVVYDADSSPFTPVSASPSAGKFAVSGSAITFNSADVGEEVIIAIDYTAPSASKVEIDENVNPPTFQLILCDVAQDEAGTKSYDVTMIFDKVRPSGNIRPPVAQKNPSNWQVTFDVLRPRAGQKPWTYIENTRS